jgi:hypothetical protein
MLTSPAEHSRCEFDEVGRPLDQDDASEDALRPTSNTEGHQPIDLQLQTSNYTDGLPTKPYSGRMFRTWEAEQSVGTLTIKTNQPRQ